MKTVRMIILRVLTLTILITITAYAGDTETVAYDGLIEPYEVVDIGAPAEGIVSRVTVDRSSPVKKGQVLIRLDASVEHAAHEKASAMAGFNGEMGLKQAQLAYARRVHSRVRKLKSVSPQDKDQAATEIALTLLRLKKARENRTLAKLELKKAKALLARRSIHSPITGVVVERYVSPGEYVNNQPLLRVAQIDPLRVEVIVPARMFGKIRPGMTAAVVPELPGYGQQTATVTIVDQVVDSASSTFGVRLELPNADLKIPSGLKCLVQFEIGKQIDKQKMTKAKIATGQIHTPFEE